MLPGLADLCFDGEPVPSSCHVRQDGLHSKIWLALGHSPTLRGLFPTLKRSHNAPPLLGALFKLSLSVSLMTSGLKN